jgi:hypothetical protein
MAEDVDESLFEPHLLSCCIEILECCVKENV